MYRVFLIDDEPWVLMGLERLIDWQALGFEIAATFDSSRAAWERLEADPPDVVFADIRMPGLTGLELLRRIRQAKLPVEAVLVSAFADFSYAQEGLRNGAFEYLLKPVQRDQLTACLVKLGERLSSLQNTRKLEEAAKTREILLKCATVEQALFSMTGRMPPEAAWAAALVTAAPLPEEGALPGTLAAFSLPLSEQETMTLCVPEDDGTALFEGLCRRSRGENPPRPFGLCADRRGKATPETMLWHARLACQTAAFIGKPGLRCAADSRPYAGEKAFFTALHNQQPALIAQHLQQLKAALFAGDLLLDRLTPLIWRLDRFYQQSQGKPSLFRVPLNRYTDLLQNDADGHALFSRLEAALAFRPEDAAVEAVMEEINARYARPQNLADLARQLNMSQAALSQLVRRKTGKTYSELVQEKRMEKACELLACSQETIVAIADRTGYADQFYFSKLFKRTFGLSPNAYRKKMKM